MNEKEQQQQQIALPSHLFVELTSLKELNFLTNASTRIKFTCLSASPLYLAVGSSGGSVYLFSRYASKYRKSLSNVPLQVIPCKEGSVTALKISPNENKIAVASSRGFIFIVTITGGKPSTTVTNVLHTGSEITALTWTRDSVRVYAGDSLGRLSCTRTGKTYFKSPCEIVLQLDSRIVQIDCYQFYVIVSTLSRCYLHDFARLTTVHVGKKLRSGSYGACFYYANEADEPVVFSARPGGRVWEVNCNGCVYNTHQFTTVKAPVAPVVDSNRNYSFPKDLQSCSLSFSDLYMICNQFLISINGSKGTVLDPRSASVVLFTSFDEDVVKYAVCGNDLFILTKDASLRKLTLFPYAKAVEKLQYRQCYTQSAQLITAYLKDNNNICPWKIELIKDVLAHLDETLDRDLITSLASLIENVECLKNDSNHTNKQVQVTKMSSGIHKVVKVMENSGYDDDFAFRAPVVTNGCDRNSLFNRRTRSGPLVTSHIVGQCDQPQECAISYNSPVAEQTASSRDDINLASPRRVSTSHATFASMTSSRSEESLCTLLGVEKQRPVFQSPTRPATIVNNDCRAPKIVTSSSYKTNGTLLLNTLALQLNVLPVVAGTSVNYTNDTTSLDAPRRKVLAPFYPLGEDVDGDNGDEAEAATPVAETPTVEDTFSYEDFKSPVLYKELSSVPNVVRRRNVRSHHHHRSTSVRKSNDKDSPSVDKVPSTIDSSCVVDKITAAENDIGKNQTGANENGQTLNTIDVTVFDTSYITTESSNRFDDAKSRDTTLPVCLSCNLHKSWHIFFRFSYFAKRLPVVRGEMNQGAVPTTVDDWAYLLAQWRSCRPNSDVDFVDPSATTFCAHCKSLYNEWLGIYSKKSETNHNEFFGVHRNSAAANTEFSWSEFEPKILERLFFSSGKFDVSLSTKNVETNSVNFDKNLSESTTTAPSSDSPSCSMYYNPLYDSCYESTTPTGNEPLSTTTTTTAPTFLWLTAVRLDLLLCCARKTLNDDEFEILLSRNSWIDEYLSHNFYRFLLLHENCQTVPNSLLDALILDVLDDDTARLNTLEKEQCSKLPFRFDICRTCPCCTLSILAKVTESEGTVIAFRCGHVFHRVCLLNTRGSSETGQSFSCLICDLDSLVKTS